MNEKEVAEIRRRFVHDKHNLTHIHGCYVGDSHEIISTFSESFGMMYNEESEKFLGLLKRTLSGSLGKNLLDIEFSTEQVMGSDTHKRLMALRETKLEDEDARQAFYEAVIASLALEGSYVILLTQESYDVPFKGRDGEVFEEGSDGSYSYFLCSICPMKLTKPALSYYIDENEFRSRNADWIVNPPELGFLFPAFEDRAANIYGALYYTRSAKDSHAEFTDAIFGSDIPMPAEAQKETFSSILAESLGDSCDLATVQAVHGELFDMMAEHKESKSPEPLALTKSTVRAVLKTCGVSDEHADTFETKYDEEFGEEARVLPRNIVDTKSTIVKAADDVAIKISAERPDLIVTRVIDGVKYILIRADEDVSINGISIHIDE